jgi:hypothetical protein
MPAGKLGPQTTGIMHLSNRMKPAFTVTEFNPPHNWKWIGRILWATIEYDHVFQEVSPEQTRLIWTVGAEGFAVSIFGSLFAKIYQKNLDTAVPLLVAEMNSSKGLSAGRMLPDP